MGVNETPDFHCTHIATLVFDRRGNILAAWPGAGNLFGISGQLSQAKAFKSLGDIKDWDDKRLAQTHAANSCSRQWHQSHH